METSSQRDLERRITGLRNEVQVQIMFHDTAVLVFFQQQIITVHLSLFATVLLGCSAWNIRCYTWRSSKMSLILNSKPTRWKVGRLNASGYICMLFYFSLRMSNIVA